MRERKREVETGRKRERETGRSKPPAGGEDSAQRNEAKRRFRAAEKREGEIETASCRGSYQFINTSINNKSSIINHQ
jgi:hypothetical protein